MIVRPSFPHGLLIVYASVAAASDTDRDLIWAGALVFAAYMQWWSWRTVTWDPAGPEPLDEADGEGATPV